MYINMMNWAALLGQDEGTPLYTTVKDVKERERRMNQLRDEVERWMVRHGGWTEREMQA